MQPTLSEQLLRRMIGDPDDRLSAVADICADGDRQIEELTAKLAAAEKETDRLRKVNAELSAPPPGDAAARIFAPPVCELSDEELALALLNTWRTTPPSMRLRAISAFGEVSKNDQLGALAMAREAKRLLLGTAAPLTVEAATKFLAEHGLATKDMFEPTVEELQKELAAANKCAEEAAENAAKWRAWSAIADESSAAPASQQSAATQKCDTCKDTGVVDQRIGGFPNRQGLPGKCPCPDCVATVAKDDTCGKPSEPARYPTPALDSETKNWALNEDSCGDGKAGTIADALREASQSDIAAAVKPLVEEMRSRKDTIDEQAKRIAELSDKLDDANERIAELEDEANRMRTERDEWKERAAEMASRTVEAERGGELSLEQLAAKPAPAFVPSAETLKAICESAHADVDSTVGSRYLLRALQMVFSDYLVAVQAAGKEGGNG